MLIATSGVVLQKTLGLRIRNTLLLKRRSGWPSFNPKDRPTMVFNNESKVENDPIHEQRIAMFNAMNLA
jgi:carboxylesterase type B